MAWRRGSAGLDEQYRNGIHCKLVNLYCIAVIVIDWPPHTLLPYVDASRYNLPCFASIFIAAVNLICVLCVYVLISIVLCVRERRRGHREHS